MLMFDKTTNRHRGESSLLAVGAGSREGPPPALSREALVSQQQGTRVAAALYLASSRPILLHLHPLPASLAAQRAFVQCVSCAVNSLSCRYVRGGGPLPSPRTSVAPARSVCLTLSCVTRAPGALTERLRSACLSPLPRLGARLCSQVTFFLHEPCWGLVTGWEQGCNVCELQTQPTHGCPCLPLPACVCSLPASVPGTA